MNEPNADWNSMEQQSNASSPVNNLVEAGLAAASLLFPHEPMDYFPVGESAEESDVAVKGNTTTIMDCNLCEDEDVVNFFMKGPVTDEEFERMEPLVKQKLLEIAEVVEKDGVQLYRAAKAKRKKTTDSNVECEAEAVKLASEPVKFDPRSYQIALVKRAIHENTIVSLGTGSGKTMIALLLIQHYTMMPRTDDENTPQTVFLVPSVALTQQQQAFLQNNLPETVGVASALAANTRRNELAKCRILVATHGAYLDLLRHYSDLFSLGKVDLLVLDECHNCKGNSAYAQIMRDYYHVLPIGRRPRVLGLTASPLINVKLNHSDEQLAQQLSSLEEIMDSTIVSVEKLDEKIDQEDRSFLEKEANEFIVDYDDDTAKYAAAFAPITAETLHATRRRELNQLTTLGKELGPLLILWYCEFLRRELSQNVYEGETEKQFLSALAYVDDIMAVCKTLIQQDKHNGRNSKLRALEKLLENEVCQPGSPVGVVFVQRRVTALALRHYFSRQYDSNRVAVVDSTASAFNDRDMAAEDSDNQVSDADKPNASYREPDTNVTCDDQFEDADDDVFSLPASKSPEDFEIVRTDYDQFEDAVDDPFADLELLEPQQSAGLSDVDTSSNKLANDLRMSNSSSKRYGVRCCALVRNPTKIFKLSTVKEKDLTQFLHDDDMKKVLNSFRSGEFNVLIATSVVEEGVDVQACSFVVVLDSLSTIKSYIQMKGRARQKNAKFYVFHGNVQTGQLNLEEAKFLEARVRRFVALDGHRKRKSSDITNPAVDCNNGGYYSHATFSGIEIDAVERSFYECENGRVSVSSAKSLLYRFALSQPIDGPSRASRDALQKYLPLFDDSCTTLLLPAYVGSSRPLRVIVLPEAYHERSKSEKQCILSLIACIRLYQHGLLTDRMLPFSRKDIQKRILKLTEVEQKEICKDYQVHSLSNWDCASCITLYQYAIFTEGERINQVRSILNKNYVRLAFLALQQLPMIPTLSYMHADFGNAACRLGSEKIIECQQADYDVLMDFYLLIWNARWKRRTKDEVFVEGDKGQSSSVVPLYVIGCLNEMGDLDWSLMKALIEEGRRDKTEYDEEGNVLLNGTILDAPRLWYPCYDEMSLYIAYGSAHITCSAALPASMQENGRGTYYDYFQNKGNVHVTRDSILFFCQRCWDLPSRRSQRQAPRELPNNLGFPHEMGTIYLKSLLVPKTLCRECPFAHAGIFLESLFLPLMLYDVERILIAEKFKNYCSKQLPTLGECITNCTPKEVLSVLTAQSCVGEETYDRLEWFGDGVLKLICTDVSLGSRDLRDWVSCLHEGDLDSVRSTMSQNNRLAQACINVGIQGFIVTSSLARGRWTPASLKLSTSDGSQSTLPQGKVCADVIEAILGLVYFKAGYDVALVVAEELTLTIPWDKEKKLDLQVQSSPARSDRLVAAAQKFTGYHPFENERVVMEAFTHPTSLDPTLGSYQRLEWIGDAVLCLAVREWIYINNTTTPVGEMVMIEESMVANETLAFLCLRAGVHKYLRHHDQSLPGRIDQYEWNVCHRRRGLWGTEPPKAMADVVESLIGAVYVDGGLEAGKRAVRFILEPVIKLFCSTDFKSIVSHPERRLRELFGDLLTFSRTHVDSISNSPCPLLAADDQICSVSQVVQITNILERPALVSADDNVSSALNRSCYLILRVLEKNQDLFGRFASARKLIQANA